MKLKKSMENLVGASCVEPVLIITVRFIEYPCAAINANKKISNKHVIDTSNRRIIRKNQCLRK